MLLVFGAPRQLRLLAGQEHGRTIPLADISRLIRCAYSERAMAGLLQELEVAARAEGLKVQLVPASTPDDIAGAFAAIT